MNGINHKVFISFKEEDIDLKNKIINKIENEIIDKHFHEDDWFVLGEYTEEQLLEIIKRDYIKDSSVTLYLLTKNSKKKNEDDKDDASHTKWMWLETKASLSERGKGNTRNGFILLIDDDVKDEFYTKSNSVCNDCKESINTINPGISLETISRNIFVREKLKCSKNGYFGHIKLKDQYVIHLKLSEFLSNSRKHIDEAFKRSQSKNYIDYVYVGENK